VSNITFIFETSPNTRSKEKKVWGTWHVISPTPEKVGGHVSRVPHQIAPIVLYIGGPNVQARGGLQPPSAGPFETCVCHYLFYFTY